MKIKAMWKVVVRFVDDNLPTILSGLAIAGLGGSVATAIKETPRAQEELTTAKLNKAEEIERTAENEHALDIYRNELGELDLKLIPLTAWEKFKVLAPVYWPCAVITAATAGCIVASNVVSKKRYLGLAALVATQAKNIDEYQDKVKEIFGEKKAAQIDKEIAKDKMAECPADITNQYVPGSKYPMHFCGCWWVGTKTEVETAFNRWNRRGLDDLMQSFDTKTTMNLEDLLYELEAAVVDPRCNFPDKSLLNHTEWIPNDGAISPEFTLTENGDGIPGYIITTNRRPDMWN